MSFVRLLCVSARMHAHVCCYVYDVLRYMSYVDRLPVHCLVRVRMRICAFIPLRVFMCFRGIYRYACCNSARVHAHLRSA